MTRLTPPMRDALKAAAKQPLRRVHTPGEGQPPWPAHPATIAALLRHELVEHAEDRDRRAHRRETWSITDLGRHTLNPPPKALSDRPRFLQRDIWRGGDYTSDPTRRIDDLPVMADPGPEWQRASERRHRGAQNRREAARQLTRNARAA